MRTCRADIHFHLLPGVDDGPATAEQALGLAGAAAAEGTGVIVATPHVRRDFVTDVSDLPERVRELQEHLTRERIEIELRCGGELAHEMVGRLRQDELETIAAGGPGARWLLLEAPFEGSGEQLHAAADELRDRGFAVVLAHPERSPVLMRGGGVGLHRELEAGSLLQVNAWSLAGGYGAEAEHIAFELLTAGLVHCLASDAHPGWREPALTVGLEKASLVLGLPRARTLTDSAPRALLERGFRSAVPT